MSRLSIFVILIVFTVDLRIVVASEQIVDEMGIQQIVGTSISHELSADLNDDDTDDRLIAAGACGNAGCTYFCFIKLSEDQYRYIGTVFLHRLGFEVLKTKHNGMSDLLSYSRRNAAEGSLLRHEFNGSEYEVTATASGNSGLFNLLRSNVRDR